MDQHIIHFYTDGACSGNPGHGGWGIFAALPDGIEHLGQNVIKLYEHKAKTTNQEMELVAASNALYVALELSNKYDIQIEVGIFSDSAYLCNGMNQKWYVNWLKNGWKNSKKEPVANKGCWESIINLMNELIKNGSHVHFVKVAGHQDNVGNVIADELARKGRDANG